MKIYIAIIISLIGLHCSSQSCPKYENPQNLLIRMETDSIFKVDVSRRIELYAELSSEVLPKYFGLKELVLKFLTKEDVIKLVDLKSRYERSRLYYLNEFLEPQARLYNNTLPYNELNAELIFKTFQLYPDTYAILVNETIPNGITDRRDLILITQLYFEYNERLNGQIKCYESMISEIQRTKRKYGVVNIFQDKRRVTPKEIEACQFVNMLMWALK